MQSCIDRVRSLLLHVGVLELSTALVIFVSSCGLINLKPVFVHMWPEEAYAVLASRNQPLSATFSAAPIRLEAERAFVVTSRGETIEGDYSWKDNTLIWSPIQPYDSSRQYAVSLEGTITMLDGRESRQDIKVPFYALKIEGQTLLTNFYPASGSSTGVGSDGSPILRFEFSQPMDNVSVEDAFSLSPSARHSFSWNDAMNIASVYCDEPLSPCRLYTWNLSTTARSLEGSPLVCTHTARFITDIDNVPPRVERVYPVVQTGTLWSEAAGDMTSIDYGLSIAIEFSEDLEELAPYTGIRVEPAMSGHVERISPRLYIYTPSNGWPPGETLTLIVPSGLRDRTGLAMIRDWTFIFAPIFPFLRVVRVESSNGEGASPSGDTTVLAATVGDSPEGLFTLTVYFSKHFDAPSMITAVERTDMSVYFPASLPSPSLKSAIWYSQDAMTLSYEGLRRSNAGATNYYVLRIPGGRQGLVSVGGMYLEEGVSLILEALP